MFRIWTLLTVALLATGGCGAPGSDTKTCDSLCEEASYTTADESRDPSAATCGCGGPGMGISEAACSAYCAGLEIQEAVVDGTTCVCREP